MRHSLNTKTCIPIWRVDVRFGDDRGDNNKLQRRR